MAAPQTSSSSSVATTLAVGRRFFTYLFPGIIAALVFCAGFILLTSGATPASRGRIELANLILPLALIEASHFIGSIIGTLLLLLARGLWLRLKDAYVITMLLLVGGIFASLAKGVDFEEATILGIIAVLLYSSRARFYRKGRFSEISFPIADVALAFLAMGLTLYFLFLANKDTPYSNDLWWEFAVEGDAARSIRAAAGSGILLVLLCLRRLLSPRKWQFIPANAAEISEVIPIVLSSPSTNAFLALLGDKEFMFSEDRSAFLMYGISGRSIVALGDPVGNPAQFSPLLWSFRERAHRWSLLPAFYQISSQYLSEFLDLGLSISKLGEEAIVNLDNFSLEGRKFSGQRNICNRVARDGFSFRIMEVAEVKERMMELRAVSDSWISDKGMSEKGFSLGSFNSHYISRGKVAVVERAQENMPHAIVAFANLWLPIPRDEFSVDLMRYNREAPKSVMEYLFTELLLWGKSQGYHSFNLGMAPLSGLESHSLAPAWHKIGSFIFQHSEHFYNFRGLRAYKERFDPVWRARYIASPGGLAFPRVLANLTTLIGSSHKKYLDEE